MDEVKPHVLPTASRESQKNPFVIDSLHVHGEPYTEEELKIILGAILDRIDTPFKTSQPARKNILIDLFGPFKAGKDTITEKFDLLFRRIGFNVFCPPETAESYDIRTKTTADILLTQAKHLAEIQQRLINRAYDRNYHLVITHRGLIDELYWYNRWMREGRTTAEYYNNVRNFIFQLLRHDLVDAFIFLTCSPETSLAREYKGSLIQTRGSNMTETVLRQARDIFDEVLADVNKNVPGLPIFHVDTTDLTIEDEQRRVLQLILPTICARFGVSPADFIPSSLTLLRKESSLIPVFNEQLKLRGRPKEDVESCGWLFGGETTQSDIYLNPQPEQKDRNGIFEEVVIVREENGKFSYAYKSPSRNSILSHNVPLRFDNIVEGQVQKLLAQYPAILRFKKSRRSYFLDPGLLKYGNDKIVLHIDTIEGFGDYTEIKSVGSPRRTHTKELFELATRLGFSPADIIEGNYLSLALARDKETAHA
ncbi:MAG: hypothetical protein A2939_00655 [Parcubacteria group bacterium RIFCSPLOWO2_01_FULL_48_18]|nr:MAG: hypothetical protein A2939_00655 [Parcubacteria group bacterium RIFCSPLOWO2_01_FULL_48_18]OHB22880.1 MAG: hypothetical protein A3J67_01195 [Parcubacteria group bacterium RIFCSPHIGHO2_02_FULL_48_10b]